MIIFVSVVTNEKLTKKTAVYSVSVSVTFKLNNSTQPKHYYKGHSHRKNILKSDHVQTSIKNQNK